MTEFSVIVVTHNRAAILRETLESLAGMQYRGSWEVLVVDNNSRDDTEEVVRQQSKNFPVCLRYLFEGTPGKYGALNGALRQASGTLVAATDDDAFPEPDWLEQAAAGFSRFDCDFVGGPVYPVWRGTPPKWLDARSATAGKVLGLQDHGRAARDYGENGISWPLGVNVAYRRDAFERVGFFDEHLGRVAGTLRNQAQREWHLRARAAGMHGFYVPEMVVHHVVEAERLSKQYFRRWYYWHGISRAILFAKLGVDMDAPDNSRLDFSRVPQLAGVPRYMYRTLAGRVKDFVKARLRGDSVAAFEHELWLCFFAGLAKQRWSERKVAIPPPQVTVS